MSKNKPPITIKSKAALRQRSEGLLGARRTDISKMMPGDIEVLVHELEVHQIELEIQNEELRQTQLELAHSRDRYSDLYDFAPVGYVTLDLHGNIIEANLTATTMLDVERRNLLGENISKFLSHNSQDEFYLHRQAVFSDAGKHVCELEMRKKNGNYLVVRMESISLADSEDRQCQAALIDVTDLRDARHRLQQLNDSLEACVIERTAELRRLAKVVSDSAEAIFIKDLKGRITDINDSVESLYGWSREELLGKSFKMLVPPEEHAQRDQLMARCLEGEEIRSVEVHRLNKDGEKLPVLLSLSVLSDDVGEAAGIVAFSEDISPLKAAEEKLRTSEQRLRTTLDAIVDAIITVDQNATIIDCNPATEVIFGRSRNDTLGQQMDLLIEGFPKPQKRQSASENKPSSVTFFDHLDQQCELVAIHKSGRRIPVEVSTNYVEEAGLGFYLVRDLSERKQLEQEILRISEDEKRELAHDLHDSLCQELSGLGYLAASLADSLKSESHSHAKQAKRISDKIVETMEDARQLSHSLDPLVEGPEGLTFALKLLASTMKLVFNIDCRFMCTDKIQLEDNSIAINLYRIAQEAVHNAYRHGKAKKVTIILKEDANSLILNIIDNGTGILETDTSSKGMGFRIMNYRIAALGGRIDIQNGKSGGVNIVCSVPKPLNDEFNRHQ